MDAIMIIIKLILFILFLTPRPAISSPLITSSIGTMVDASSVIVLGSNFGVDGSTHLWWAGGATGDIESGASDAHVSSFWDGGICTDSAFQNCPTYSTTKSHSGSKSIKSEYNIFSAPNRQYDSTFIYDTGLNGIGIIYLSFWAYFDLVDTAGQWKIFRIMNNDTSVSDSDGTLYFSQWYKSDGSNLQEYLMLFCDQDDYGKCYPGSDGDLRSSASSIPSRQWVRIEFWGVESSSDGTRDGSLDFQYQDQTHGPVQMLTGGPWSGTIITRASGVTYRWRYITFQNYWGNLSVGDGTKEKVYIDDIYIQTGTMARIELCDNGTWANRKHCEIQYPTAWSDGSLTVVVNKGSFGVSDSAYLYVVDAAGAVSDGYPITLGQSYGQGQITGSFSGNVR
jgi:hypothetical protein